VVEVNTLVPHRIPDPIGDAGDIPSSPVDEDHIEVAERAQFPPAVTADGHQGQAPRVSAGGSIEEATEPRIGGIAVGPTECVALQIDLLDKRLASFPQGHQWTVPPRRLGGNDRGVPTGLMSAAIALIVVSDDRSGLKTFDLVLLIGGGIIAALVAFALLHFVVGVIWFAIKFLFVIAVIGLIAWLVVGRRK
jgi:hypothetical protein